MMKQFATVLIIAVAAFGFTSIASAQDNSAATTQNDVRSLIQKLRQKTAKLQQIHAQTLKSNSDLRDQQKQFATVLRQAIEDQGYDIEAGSKRVKGMAQKLQSGDLSESERQAVIQDITAERQSLRKARAAALQQPEVQTAGKALQKNTIAAMKEQNPDVEQLIQDMKNLRNQLRTAAQQAAGK